MENFKNLDVIATPIHKNNSGGGVVEIVFFYDENNTLQPINDDMFPSGKCWVINDYEERIERIYKQGELFRLNSLNKTNYGQEDAKSPESYVEWCCTTANRAQSAEHDLFRVINCALPDKNTGILDWQDENLQRGVYFINNKEKVYGPFEVTIELNADSRIYTAFPYNTPSVPINSHHITVSSHTNLCKKNILHTISLNNQDRSYIGNLKSFTKSMRNTWEVIDFISASQLLKFISPLKNKSNNSRLMSNSVLTQVKSGIELFLKERGDRLPDQNRYLRAIKLLESSESHKNTWMDTLDSFVKTPLGIKALKEHAIDKHVKEDNESLKSIKSEFKQIEIVLEGRKEELNTINNSIIENTSKLTRTRDAVEKEVRDHNKILQTEKESLERTIELKKIELSDLQSTHAAYDTLDKVTQETHDLERDKTRLNTAVEQMKTILQNPKILIEKMTEVHSVMDILGYSQRISSNEMILPPTQKKSKNTVVEANLESAINVIHTITLRINEIKSRELSEVETANLLICIQQNFITILQGRPGVGKTSTAINLAKALGIHDESCHGHDVDFLNIPVARGWTGTRDLIGFYNGLRGIFQPAKTGLYQFLVNGEEFGEDANSRIVLLDEANLSPIEHYWSEFIGLTDKEGAGRAIDTGESGDRRFLHPAKHNSLRFIATINNDSTTEPLSPRLLNRAPVICMDHFEVTTNGFIGGEIIDFKGAFSVKMLEALFGRTSQIDDNFRGEDLLVGVQKVIEAGIEKAPTLKEVLNIEGRKYQSIVKYLDVAGALMIDNKAQAQDFALSQFILPHLKGEGDKVRLAIMAMIDQARSNDLERSAQIMERILNDGDSYLQSYSFL